MGRIGHQLSEDKQVPCLSCNSQFVQLRKPRLINHYWYGCFMSVLSNLSNQSAPWYLIYQADLIFFRVWKLKKYTVASILFFRIWTIDFLLAIFNSKKWKSPEPIFCTLSFAPHIFNPIFSGLQTYPCFQN